MYGYVCIGNVLLNLYVFLNHRMHLKSSRKLVVTPKTETVFKEVWKIQLKNILQKIQTVRFRKIGCQ